MMKNIDWSLVESNYALTYEGHTKYCKDRPELISGFWYIGGDIKSTGYRCKFWSMYERPITPIYTKDMADNGELPSVGMEFRLDYYEEDSRYNDMNKSILKVLSVSECGVISFEAKGKGMVLYA